MTRGSTPRRGMSLLEVIVATGVFFAAATVIGQLLQLGLLATEGNRTLTIGLLRCESKLEEVVAGIQPLTPTDQPKPFGDDPRWQWSLFVDPTEIAGLQRVVVVVERRDETDEIDFSTSLTRLVAAPIALPTASAPPFESLDDGPSPPPRAIRELLGLPAKPSASAAAPPTKGSP